MVVSTPEAGAEAGPGFPLVSGRRDNVIRWISVAGAIVLVWAFVHYDFVGVAGGWLTVDWTIVIVAWMVFVFAAPVGALLPFASTSTPAPVPPPSPQLLARVRWVRVPAAVLTVIAGALAMQPSQTLALMPVAVAVTALVADVRVTVWAGFVVALIGALVLPVGTVIAGGSVGGLLALEASMVVWVLLGNSRRQARLGEAQAIELQQRELAIRTEQARSAALADRQAVARDLHDVLAHSLGGLVIQLDAALALGEAGRSEESVVRVAQARQLAVDGLRDASRAVAALRSAEEQPESTSAAALEDAAGQLATVHRSLGGHIDLEVELGDGMLPSELAAALERALQESLSNARRHAPGAAVSARLTTDGERVELTVANACAETDDRDDAPLERAGDASSAADLGGATRLGGGHGLAGMAERFALLGGSAAGTREGDRFVVHAQAPL